MGSGRPRSEAESCGGGGQAQVFEPGGVCPHTAQVRISGFGYLHL